MVARALWWIARTDESGHVLPRFDSKLQGLVRYSPGMQRRELAETGREDAPKRRRPATRVREHEEWVERMGRGDTAALAKLYRAYAGRVRLTARQMLGDPVEADDLVHDVFLEAWRRARDYDPARGTVLAWLLLRARSRAMDRRKTARVRRVTLMEGPIEPATGNGPPSDAELDTGHLQAALRRLKIAEREVLCLGYFEGLTSREIATRLAIPVGTVKSRTRAALNKIRKIFQDERV